MTILEVLPILPNLLQMFYFKAKHFADHNVVFYKFECLFFIKNDSVLHKLLINLPYQYYKMQCKYLKSIALIMYINKN